MSTADEFQMLYSKHHSAAEKWDGDALEDTQEWLMVFLESHHDLIARALRRDAEIESPSDETLDEIHAITQLGLNPQSVHMTLAAFRETVR